MNSSRIYAVCFLSLIHIYGRISDESPVGAALLGHSAGDKVEITLPTGAVVLYEVPVSYTHLDVYKRQSLDGAGRLTQFFQITIPLIWTNIRTTLTLSLIHI